MRLPGAVRTPGSYMCSPNHKHQLLTFQPVPANEFCSSQMSTCAHWRARRGRVTSRDPSGSPNAAAAAARCIPDFPLRHSCSMWWPRALWLCPHRWWGGRGGGGGWNPGEKAKKVTGHSEGRGWKTPAIILVMVTQRRCLKALPASFITCRSG